MPLLNDGLNQFDIDGTGYGFSGTRLDRLGASEYTLVGLAVDTSSSVAGHRTEIERCVGQIVEACRLAPRADNLMLRLTRFANDVSEFHGFKPLMECAPNDYQGALPCQGLTALFDGTFNAVEAVGRYGADLVNHGLTANGIVFVITDGGDNHSSLGSQSVRSSMEAIRSSETLEGLLTVLIAVGVEDMATVNVLKDFSTTVGFDGFIDLGSADAATLAGLSQFVSRHINLQSRVLGTGGGSVSLTF